MNKVYLVGAGCGDPALLSLKGKACIEEADCILYDRLIDPSLLSYAKADCKLIYVGKENHKHTMPQAMIQKLLVDAGRTYPVTVRLKGGDPYVFGRGAEEGLALAQAGIAFEVVCGISSAIGGLAYAGIPVTHRGYTNGFRVYTAHSQKDVLADLNFAELAKTKDTLIFLMGLRSAMQLVEKLLACGMEKATPMAICSHVSMPSQKVLTTTLAELHQKDIDTLSSPAIIVIGEVVKLREKLCFYEQKPLFQKRYLLVKVQKEEHQAAKLLREQGAWCEEVQCGYCKAIAHTWTKEAFQSFTHVVFTSAQVVHILMKQLQEAGFDSRILYQCKLCVMGKGTKKALAQYGLCADLMPNIHDSKHMAELLTASVQKQDHILLPKAVNGNTYLQKTLETQCKVSYVPLYTIEELPHSIQDEDYDGVLMTCPFSVQQYAKQTKHRKQMVYAMGERTKQALIKEGFTSITTLKHAEMEEFVKAILHHEKKGRD